MPEKQCLFHSGMEAQDDEACRRCDSLEETNKDQWTELGRKPSSKVIMWGFGILIIVLLSAFGGLWRSQVGIEVKIVDALNSQAESNAKEQREMNRRIEDVRLDLAVLQTGFNNYLKENKKHDGSPGKR